GEGERGDPAGADATGAAQVGVIREADAVLAFDHGQKFLVEETRVGVGHRVVFVGPVAPGDRLGAGRRHDAGIEKHADRHRHFATVNQVVEYDGHAGVAGGAGVAAAVVEHHEGSGSRAVV